MGAPDDSELDPADRAVLDALWTGVINGWDDDDRHRKFLDHAREVGALMEAARRYGSLRDDPERGMALGLSAAQLVSLGVMAACVAGWLRLRPKERGGAPSGPTDDDASGERAPGTTEAGCSS